MLEGHGAGALWSASGDWVGTEARVGGGGSQPDVFHTPLECFMDAEICRDSFHIIYLCHPEVSVLLHLLLHPV